MPTLKCAICGVKKDQVDDYYKSNPTTCKDCWKQRCRDITKSAKDRNTLLLTQVLEEQREIKDEIIAYISQLDARMRKMEKTIRKLQSV
jgi:recombinational DNA repair protein (RecF pathway)